MPYVVLMVAGLFTGMIVDNDGDALWGLLFGFMLAHMIRLSRRLTFLERRMEDRDDSVLGTVEPPPVAAATPQPEAPPGPVDEPATEADGPEPVPVAFATRAEDIDPAPVALKIEPQVPESAKAVFEAKPVTVPPETLLEVARETEADVRPREVPSPLPPRTPREPPLISRAFGAVVSFFTTGNPLVRVGALVLFVGVAFLLKYISERVNVPVEMRLLGVAAGGLAMVVVGLMVRQRRPGFALPFQGAGIGVLYLTTFAALRLYPVLPASAALMIMLVVVALTIFLALWQDASALAIFGVVGGFLAPVLTSTGQGSHVELFSFYLVLNIAVAVIAWFRAWRWLNWLGFVFTFGIGSIWGAKYYSPQYFQSTEPFLLAHVFLYLAIAVLFAHRQPPRLKGLVDGTLVFGTPLVGFTLQALLLEGDEVSLATSSALFGLIYLGLRQILLMRDREHFQLLGQCFLALGAGFLTLAIPLAFDARVTSAMWTLEGMAVAWIGIHQSSLIRRWAGYALMGVGSLAYLLENGFGAKASLVFLNADFIGVAIIALGFAFIADQLRRHDPDPKFPILPALMWLYGSAWWFVGGLVEVERQLTGVSLLLTTVVFFAVSALPMVEFGRRQAFAMARWVAIAACLLLAVMTLGWRVTEIGPLLRNANTLAAAGVLAILTICGHRLNLIDGPRIWSNILAIVGFGLWLMSGLLEMDSHFDGVTQFHSGLIFVSLSLMAGYWAATPLNWPEWRRCVEVMAVVPGLFLLQVIDRHAQPLADLGGLAWPLAFAVLYALLRWRETSNPSRLAILHAVGFWSLIALITDAAQVYAGSMLGSDSAWRIASFGGVPLILAGAVGFSGLSGLWPLSRHGDSYHGRWLLPVLLWLTGWLVISNAAPPGQFALGGYLPVLNVQDLVSLGALWLLVHWWSRRPIAADAGVTRLIGSAIGLLGFLFLNAALLRALHFYLPIAWDFDRMLDSFTVQASLTLLWMSTALVTMVIGSRTTRRWLWMVGAALMGVVVVKLFAVDTAASGTLARIAAFFGVAIGLFVAGYFVPRPPAAEGSDESWEAGDEEIG